jgi:gamma-glutamyl:cysteine ligase YbdK (ATP-grasp superfamily)
MTVFASDRDMAIKAFPFKSLWCSPSEYQGESHHQHLTLKQYILYIVVLGNVWFIGHIRPSSHIILACNLMCSDGGN